MISQEKILIEYIKENQEKLYKVAYSYTREKESALDIVQESITKALENIKRLKNDEFVKTWFYRILINESLQYVKKNKRLLYQPYEDNQKDNMDYEDTVTENIVINNAIKKLNNKLKTVIILRYFENMKIEEIAQITKTNINTVKSRLYKGLQELKEKIGKEELF